MLVKSALRAVVAAAGFSIVAASAYATPVLISKQEDDVFGSNGRASVTITDDIERPSGIRVGAGGFALTGGDLGDFVAWCLDIGTYLRLSSNYNVEADSDGFIPFASTTPRDLIQKANVQALFNTAFSGLDLTSDADSAGFQLALWEVVYEDSGTFDVTGGDFNVSGNTAAQSRANDFLDGIDGPITQQYLLTFLESADTRRNGLHKSQNLVTATPVPLPAAGFLMLGALAGLGAMRRRQKR